MFSWHFCFFCSFSLGSIVLANFWDHTALARNNGVRAKITVVRKPYGSFAAHSTAHSAQPLSQTSAWRTYAWVSQLSPVQLLSHVWLFATSWIGGRHPASLSITNSRSLLRLMPIKSVMPSSHLILCRPLLLLPPIPPSIRVFSNESTLRMTWPKYWSLSFSISPSNEHPGLIAFKDGLVGSLCSPRDSQESSPTP